MTPVNFLLDTVDTLWYWTYGIIVGWGTSFTIVVAILIAVMIKLARLSQRINQLETRLIHAERDYNLSINASKSK